MCTRVRSTSLVCHPSSRTLHCMLRRGSADCFVPHSKVVTFNACPEQMKEKHSTLLRRHHEYFHRVWGCLLKSGYQNSRYAHQIERFACLYASHVSNLSFYSPDKSWRCALSSTSMLLQIRVLNRVFLQVRLKRRPLPMQCQNCGGR